MVAAAAEEGQQQRMHVPSDEIKMDDIESNDFGQEEEEEVTIVERGLKKRQASVLFPPER